MDSKISRIVVVGSCNTDLISYIPRLPTPGETIQGHRFSMGFGGKGANQCVAATRLGATATLVSMVGDDIFGHTYLQNLRDNGVDVTYVGVTKEAATGVAPIAVDDAGENSIIIVPGANLKLSCNDVEKAESVIKGCSVVVCQGEIDPETTLAALKMARKHKVMTLMNAAPADANMSIDILKNSDIFCVNESEAEVLTKKEVKTVEDAYSAADTLISRGCLSVLVTLGEKGAVYVSKDKRIMVPAPTVTPVDTTGAGDAFVGALAYYLSHHPGLSIEEVMKRSCHIASVSVQAPGTQSSYPTRDSLPDTLF